MILDELSKKNDYWHSIAFNICKDKDLCKDLVQDMYLKIYDVSLKRELDINDYYVILTIRNLYIDWCKENNKTVSTDTLFDLESNVNTFEPNDNELKVLNELSFLERELLTHYETMSYRDIQKKFNINFQFARRTIINVQQRNGKKSNK